MNRDDILTRSIWTEGKLEEYSSFFDKKVLIMLSTSLYNLKATKTILSEQMVDTVNDFLNIPEGERSKVIELLYQHAMECCSQVSYGFELLPEECETDANIREFDIQNSEKIIEKANFDHAFIEEDELRKNRFVKLVFYPEWEQEHGCELILKNGRFLNFVGESDTFLGQFDN